MLVGCQIYISSWILSVTSVTTRRNPAPDVGWQWAAPQETNQYVRCPATAAKYRPVSMAAGPSWCNGVMGDGMVSWRGAAACSIQLRICLGIVNIGIAHTVDWGEIWCQCFFWLKLHGWWNGMDPLFAGLLGGILSSLRVVQCCICCICCPVVHNNKPNVSFLLCSRLTPRCGYQHSAAPQQHNSSHLHLYTSLTAECGGYPSQF